LRKFAVLGIASIFVLTGFIGGAFVPLVQRAMAASLVPNMRIQNLPRPSVEIGTRIHEAGIPTVSGLGGGDIVYMALVRGGITEFRARTTANWSNTGVDMVVPLTAEYNRRAVYSWRIYLQRPAISPATGFRYDLLHSHNIDVYQGQFRFEIPTSARHYHDGNAISFIPNVAIPGQRVLMPLPNQFIDNAGNDLFDNNTPDVALMRRAILADWNRNQIPGVADSDDPANDAVNTQIANDPNLFRRLVWANTTIQFFGPGKGAAPRQIYTGNQVNDATGTNASRVFQSSLRGEFRAQFEFNHPRIQSRTSTDSWQVEGVTINTGGTSVTANEANIRENVVFTMPPAFGAMSGAFTLNQYFQLPLPTINIATRSDTDALDLPMGHVSFPNTNSMVSYTFITVEHFDLQNNRTNLYNNIRLTAENGYRFRPTTFGSFRFVYHTTTPFGVGFVEQIGANDPQYHNRVVVVQDGGQSFIQYTPHNLFRITNNAVAPSLRWTLPFNYHLVSTLTGDDAAAVTAYNAAMYNTALHILPTHTIALAEANPLFNLAANSPDRILEHIVPSSNTAIVERTQRDGALFNNAPDLSHFMPGMGSTPVTIIPTNGQIVIPALLGLNNVSSSRQLTYSITITRRRTDSADTDSVQFTTSPTAQLVNDTDRSVFRLDNRRPLIIEFGQGTAEVQRGRFTNGTQSEVHIRSFGNTQIPVAQTYEIAIEIIDNASVLGSGGNMMTPTIRHSFRIDDNIGNTVTDHQELRPSFSGTPNPVRTGLYVRDTLNFRELGVWCDSSNNVAVDYYIVWNTSAGAAADGFQTNAVRIQDRHIRSNTILFPLDVRSNPDAQPLITYLDANPSASFTIVAIARNRHALVSQVYNNFQPRSDTYPVDPTGRNDVLTFDELHTFLTATNIVEARDNLPAGTNISFSRFTLNNFGGGVAQTLALTPITGAVRDTRVNITANIRNAAAGQIDTNINAQVVTPSGRTLTVSGAPFNTLVTQTGTEFRNLTNLSFLPTERGTHTLIITARNRANVTVYTHEFEVGGTATVIPVLEGGATTLRIGQVGNLPRLYVFYNDIRHIVGSDNRSIVPEATPNGTPIGTFNTRVLATSDESWIPSVHWDSGTVFFLSEDTYTLVFEIYLNSAPATPITVYRPITVTGLTSDDFDVSLDSFRQDYLALPGRGFTHASPTGSAGTFRDYNILPDFVNQIAGDMTLSDFQLDQGMVHNNVVGATGSQRDSFSFGRIVLPNVAPNFNDLVRAGMTHLRPDDIRTRTTVTHSRRPATPIFDSATGTEQHLIVNGSLAEHYYFFPSGTVEVPVDERRRPGDVGMPATIPTPTPSLADAVAQNLRKVVDYYGNAWFRATAVATDTDWFTFDDYIYNPSRLVDRSQSPDGIYTIVYTVTIRGISQTREFRIAVGDVAIPIITFLADEDELFADRDPGGMFTIETARDLAVNPAGGRTTIQEEGFFAPWWVAHNMEIRITRPNGDNVSWTTDTTAPIDGANLFRTPAEQLINFYDSMEAVAGANPPAVGTNQWGFPITNANDEMSMIRRGAGDREGRQWRFRFQDSGDYTITFEIQSDSGQRTSVSRTVRISTPETPTRIAAQTIWGAVLIVISSGLLIGVIVYFIQTGRKTKFQGTGGKPTTPGPKGEKKFMDRFKKKDKADAPKVEAPKKVDAPKADKAPKAVAADEVKPSDE